MFEKSIEKITHENLQSLVDNSVRESTTLDYKHELPGNDDKSKVKFLRGVSAFANASGGYLIYGMEEKKDEDGKNTGEPERIVGLENINFDHERLRLMQMIQAGIEPRIPGIQMEQIVCGDAGPVVVIHIPRSWIAPHMVTLNHSPSFFSRTSGGKYPFDYRGIRDAFIASTELPERIRRFRDDRIGIILSGETPLPLTNGPILVLHYLSVSVFDISKRIDIPLIPNMRSSLMPFNHGFSGSRFNFDGYVTGDVSDGRCKQYLQVFRNGAIETVETEGFHIEKKNTACNLHEKDMLGTLEKCLQFGSEVGQAFPFFVMISMLGVKGYKIGNSSRRIERDHLIVPEIMIENAHESTDRILRPAFDAIWQAAGEPQCPNYKKDGKWVNT